MIFLRNSTNNAPAAKKPKTPFLTIFYLRILTSGPPVDGGWSDWTWPDTCRPKSDTCKWKVTQTGRRECDRPQPAFGGRDCSGEETGTRECYDCDLGKNSHHFLPSSKLLLNLPSRIYRVGGLSLFTKKKQFSF